MQSECLEDNNEVTDSADQCEDLANSDIADYPEQSDEDNLIMNECNFEDGDDDKDDEEAVLFDPESFPLFDSLEEGDTSGVDKNERRNRLINREKSLNCKICSKSFSRIGYLKLHLKVHERDPMFKCHLCPKQYTAKSNLKIHIKTHTGERPYKCGICSHTSYSLSNLRKHMRIHTGERKHQCPICERWFMEKTAMTNHVRLHSGEKPFHCDICDEAFVRKTSLKYHMSSHTGERKYTCTYCTRSFSHRGNLNQHLRLHTGETPFQCELCPRAFKSVTSLQYHKKVHLNTLAYKCGICQRQFVQNSHLTNHMRTHTGEKPYKCDVCDKSFAQKSSLNSHTRIHTGERPFVCEFCGKSYSHQYYLNQHRRQHPEYIPDPFATRITQHDRNFKKMLIKKLVEVGENENELKDINEIKTELEEVDVPGTVRRKETVDTKAGLRIKKQPKKKVSKRKPKTKVEPSDQLLNFSNKSKRKKRQPQQKKLGVNTKKCTVDSQPEVLSKDHINSQLQVAELGSNNSKVLSENSVLHDQTADQRENNSDLNSQPHEPSSDALKTPILLNLMKRTKPNSQGGIVIQKQIDCQTEQSDISHTSGLSITDRKNGKGISTQCLSSGSLHELATSESKSLNPRTTKGKNCSDMKEKYSILRAVLSNVPQPCTPAIETDAHFQKGNSSKPLSAVANRQFEDSSSQTTISISDDEDSEVSKNNSSDNSLSSKPLPIVSGDKNGKLSSSDARFQTVTYEIQECHKKSVISESSATCNSIIGRNSFTNELGSQTELCIEPENLHLVMGSEDTAKNTSLSEENLSSKSFSEKTSENAVEFKQQTLTVFDTC